ncbi:hypothetical protein GmRootV213_28820 [Variovorax sp. V213]|uniref:hypothetical protein n=1 Tax=Variovorax sp. V213 TaxID=3065955 RepID=UPI0034E8465C
MQKRLQQVGDVERPQHYFLEPDHRCYFWGEYTPWEHTGGRKWNFSETNQLIANFKKPMDRRGKDDWWRKQAAIDRTSQAFAGLWKWQLLHERGAVLIPVPPSKRAGDPLHDDRMSRMLQGIRAITKIDLDIRDLLVSDGSIPASHTSAQRPSPQRIYESLSFDAHEREKAAPNIIYLFDDVLTSGAHFVSCLRRLRELYSEQPIVGNFVARCGRPNTDAVVPLNDVAA